MQREPPKDSYRIRILLPGISSPGWVSDMTEVPMERRLEYRQHGVAQHRMVPLLVCLLLAAGCGTSGTAEHEPAVPPARAYQAEAWIRIRFEPQFVLSAADERPMLYAENQVQLIRSPLVMRKVLADQAIADMAEIKETDDPVNWLIARTSVKQQGESEFYVISFGGPAREAAVQIVNAICRS